MQGLGTALRKRVAKTIEEVIYDYPAMLVQEAELRVEAGMAWLDENKPDWFDKFVEQGFERTSAGVVPTLFDITSGHFCVIGITYGSYDYLVERFPQDWRTSHGFTMGDAEDDLGIDWRLLQRVWSFKVEERLGIVHV